MIVEVRHQCSDYNSYRAARVKSLFNAESGCNWEYVANLPIENRDWKIGLIVGPSGSGKTSIGGRIFDAPIHDLYAGWDKDKPIVDCIAPDGDFNAVTGALAAVGLGDVPAWLRPFHVLSNGEKFRAGLARLVCECPEHVVIDEFTSVIDRQIAKIGSLAFAKSWRRGTGQIILLSCHYDIIEWLQPDWVYDTREARFSRDCLRQRPTIELRIYKVKGSVFRHFKPHYYLDLPLPVAAEYFVGMVGNEPVCHIAVCPMFVVKAYRATRLVTLPEWQGAGVGTRFLDFIGEYHLRGNGRLGYKYPTFFHTSHPQLCAALRHSKKWVQTGASLYGGNKVRSAKSIKRSRDRKGSVSNCLKSVGNVGYGGHFRAVQAFKYIGEDGSKDIR
jgi:GNAT superfamily N-acetyltransferase